VLVVRYIGYYLVVVVAASPSYSHFVICGYLAGCPLSTRSYVWGFLHASLSSARVYTVTSDILEEAIGQMCGPVSYYEIGEYFQ
jgi:hypothetical protein